MSLRERARSLYCGEGETDLVIEYCKIQRSLPKTVIFPTFELQQGLHILFASVFQEIVSGRLIDFIILFKAARSIFPEGGIMHQYDCTTTFSLLKNVS